MGHCKFRKLSSVIILSIFALMAEILGAVPFNPPPAASLLAQQRTCRSVSGLSPLLKRGNVLLFGEKHGTQQIPAFISDVVCITAKKRIPITLGLEIPFDEQAAIDRFLDSGGGAAAEAQLTEGAFWHREIQDGRSSMAVLQLIEQARALRAAGAKLRIVAYDAKPGLPGQERDRVMARNLAAVAGREPKNLLVLLSGNFHNRLTRGTSWDQEYEPMGYLLTKSISSSRIISLNVAHEGGEGWVCVEQPPDSKLTCKALPFKPETGAPAWSVKLTAEPNSPYSGTFGVGRISASPPAH